MHELSVAAALFDWALGEARTRAPKRLLSIELEQDPLSCLNPEALRFGFEALTADSRLSGVRLDFVSIDPTYRCGVCGEHLKTQPAPLACSRCGSPMPRLSRESSLSIRSIEVEP